MNKDERRKTHAAINAMKAGDVRKQVQQAFPKATGAKLDQLAKKVVAHAHRLVSPRD